MIHTCRKYPLKNTWILRRWVNSTLRLPGQEENRTVTFNTTRLHHLEENVAVCELDLPESLTRQIRLL